MSLQRIPHDTTKYKNNQVEILNVSNRMRIGVLFGASVKISPILSADNSDVTAHAYITGYNPYKAIDGNNATDGDCWTDTNSSLPNSWWQIRFSSPKQITGYKISGYYNGTYYPTAWTISGSNNGTDFTQIDSRSGQTLSGSLSSLYSIASPGAYLYFRITISAMAGIITRGLIGEIEIYGSDLIYNNYIGA